MMVKTNLLLILFGIFCLNTGARELPAPPAGFKKIIICDDTHSLLQPEGWHFKQVNYNANAEGYFITKERLGTNEVFETGFTLNIATHVKKKTGKKPSAYADTYLARQSRQGRQLDAFSREIGPYQNVGGSYLINGEKGEEIHHWYLMANDATDTLFIYMFKAPKEQWDEAWKTGEIIFNNLQRTYEMIQKKHEFLNVLRLTNRYLMEKWSDPGDDVVTDRTRPSNLWTRSVYYAGLMALYKIDPKPEFLEYAEDWARSHHWGLRDGDETRHADNQACGSTYIELYKIKADRTRIRDIQTSLDAMLDGDTIDDWDWIDALFMSMPVFAGLADLTKNPAYSERMYAMYMDTKVRQGLWNPEDHLWWRDKDFLPPYTEPNGEDCYWARGNGWVVAAMARVLEILPDDPHRDEYRNMLLQMLEALVPLQREDGFWNVSLHDPNHFGGKETSATALFTYAMAWAINRELVDADQYEPVVWKAWNAMVANAMHPNGQLGYVQSTGKEPADGQPVTYDHMANHEDYGLGCFLLAGSEVYRLLDTQE